MSLELPVLSLYRTSLSSHCSGTEWVATLPVHYYLKALTQDMDRFCSCLFEKCEFH